MDQFLAADQVATMGMVRLELLGGARTQEQWQRLRDLLSALHYLPVEEEHWEEAARWAFQLRRQGVRAPFTNPLMGAALARHGAVLVHRDRHFDIMAMRLGLQVESYVVGPLFLHRKTT